MGTGDNLTITLTGGGPWGFRLIGGEGYPLQIAKIRKRSKAHSKGLQEGDTILSINGAAMQGKSHQEAMYHVDNAGDSLSIKVRRDSSQKPLQTVRQNHQPITNGVGPQPVVIQGPTKTTSYITANGDVTRQVTTQQQHQTSANGRTTQVFVKQEHTLSTNKAPSGGQWQRTQSNQTSMSESQRSVTPVKMFNVKKIVTESRNENITPPTFLQKAESPAPTPVTFKVRDIKGSMGQAEPYNERGVYSPAEVLPAQAPQYSPSPATPEPPYMTPPELAPPSPAPPSLAPPPPAPPLPPQHAAFPSNEPLMYPVPKGPYLTLDEIDTQMRGKMADGGMIYNDNFNMGESDFHHLPIFAPKVEIKSQARRDMAQMYVDASGRPDLLPLDLTRTASLDSGEYSDPGTPDTGSTATRKKKKLYSDSAFYDAPGADYPTIEQQVVLCKKIAHSLTSAANRKARGAKMFAKRKFKSMRWIHDGESHHEESSLGDIADLRDLDSELHQEDGGYKPLFTFRIPNVKHRIGVEEDTYKMSISQDEFEALRLQKKKCDHRSVSPNTCHNLVADLSSPRNKGAKLFQKRQARSEKWVIDETNAKKPMMPPAQLNALLAQTTPKGPTPWEAALSNEGRVDHAFDQMDSKNYSPSPNSFVSKSPVPPPAQKIVHHNLRSEGESANVITGPNFNRTPKGWGSGPPVIPANYSLPAEANYAVAPHAQHQQRPSWKQEQPPPPPPKPLKQQDNYNRKIRAWKSGADTNSQMATTNAEWFRGPGGNMGPQQQQQYGYQATHQYNHMASNMMPATDL